MANDGSSAPALYVRIGTGGGLGSAGEFTLVTMTPAVTTVNISPKRANSMTRPSGLASGSRQMGDQEYRDVIKEIESLLPFFGVGKETAPVKRPRGTAPVKRRRGTDSGFRAVADLECSDIKTKTDRLLDLFCEGKGANSLEGTK